MVLAVGDKVLFCSCLLCGCEWSEVADGSTLREGLRETERERDESCTVPRQAVSNVKGTNKVYTLVVWCDLLFSVVLQMSNSLVVVCCVMLPGCLRHLSQFVLGFFLDCYKFLNS